MQSLIQLILTFNKAVKLLSTRVLLILGGGGIAAVFASCLRDKWWFGREF